MGIMQSLLRKERKASSRGNVAEHAVRPAVTQSPSIVLLVPDAQGIATYHMHTFPTVRAAELYVDVTLRGQVPDRSVTFWALNAEPQPDYYGEPLVIVRDAERPVVYLFSFADLDSSFDFLRHEMTRGLDLAQVVLYWAAPAAIEMDFWGRAAVSPQAAPPVRQAVAAAPATNPVSAIAHENAEAPDVIPFVPRVESTDERPRYLTESDIADTVREMQDFTTRFDAERAEVIDFPVASGSLRRHKMHSRAKAAWQNFAHALDEALDVYVAEQVRVRLAINRIVRALAQAAFIHQNTPQIEAQAPRPAQRGPSPAWFYASVALADAATIQVRRSLMRRVWLNTAWTLEEAVYAHRLETNARVRRAWHALSHEFAAGASARAARDTAIRDAWSHLATELPRAAEAQLAARRSRLAWNSATLAIVEACRAHTRHQKKVAIAWARLARAFKQVATAHEKQRKTTERIRVAAESAAARHEAAARKAAERAAAAASKAEARAAEAAAKAAERERLKAAKEAERAALAAASAHQEPLEDLSESEQISRWLDLQGLESGSRKPRWEPREEPFEGFRSPPGRF